MRKIFKNSSKFHLKHIIIKQTTNQVRIVKRNTIS